MKPPQLLYVGNYIIYKNQKVMHKYIANKVKDLFLTGPPHTFNIYVHVNKWSINKYLLNEYYLS